MATKLLSRETLRSGAPSQVELNSGEQMEYASCGQPVKGDVKGKGPLKPVEATEDINQAKVGGEGTTVTVSQSYNVEAMADTELPMEGGEEEGEVGGEDTVFSHNYNFRQGKEKTSRGLREDLVRLELLRTTGSRQEPG
ncbi:hypothetical protein J5N97_020692 [Dioscorea zingiberensis]|uniref:Uncharacterized protein n=1 Tax=Dioscorea zingiberensis TaxID=325984 RepID=A0A9D5CGC3_9LILI|nr:hypothetical protein J5N97_020692 [Dioscorea zingiberensis]